LFAATKHKKLFEEHQTAGTVLIGLVHRSKEMPNL